MGHDQVNAQAPRPWTRGTGAGRLADQLPVDELDLADAVLGDRLILHEDGLLEIRTVRAGRASLLGTFEDAAAAWRALDDLDAPPQLLRHEPA